MTSTTVSFAYPRDNTRHDIRSSFALTVWAPNAKDRRKYVFPWAPTDFALSGFTNTYSTVDRPGRVPLYEETGRGLPTVSFSLTLAYRYNTSSIEAMINALASIARSNSPIVISFAPFTVGYWRCTTMDIATTQFNQHNQPTRATATCVFTRMSDVSSNVGPVSGGVKPAPAKGTKTTTSKTGTAKKKKISVYTVRSGDTLWSICQQHYHDPNKWHYVADYNKIKNPSKIRVGQKIKLP